jgi:hypothetical protein
MESKMQLPDQWSLSAAHARPVPTWGTKSWVYATSSIAYLHFVCYLLIKHRLPEIGGSGFVSFVCDVFIFETEMQ